MYVDSTFKNDFFKAFDIAGSEVREIVRMMEDAETPEEIDAALEFANEIVEGNGIEGIQEGGEIILLYVNMGDTYDRTVLYDPEKEEFTIGSWGDFYETWEAEQASEEMEDEDE